MMPTLSTLDLAIAYARQGWPIFPVQPWPSKAPITANGFHDATTDENQIKLWWADFPEAQIGVDCGQAQLVMGDLDENPATFTSGRVALESIGVDPDTCASLIMRTPSRRGMQAVFSGVGIPRMLGVLPGVDILGYGGYSILPSPNSPGREWVAGDPFEPDDLDPVPGWLVQLVQSRPVSKAGTGMTSGKVMPLDPVEEEKILAALQLIPSDERGTWIRVGMALKSTGAGERAYEIWEDWSKGSDKFDPVVQRKQWDSLHELRVGGSEVTIATVFHLADKWGTEELDEVPEVIIGPQPEPEEDEKPREGIQLLTHHEVAELPPIEWLIEGLLPLAVISLLAGDTEAGKSFLAIDLAMRMIYGLPFCGHEINHPGSVVYLAGEGQDGLAARFKAWMLAHEHLGLDEEGRYCMVSSEIPTLDKNTVSVLSGLLEAVAKDRGHMPKLVIIDTLSQGLDDDENEAKVVAPVIRALMALKRRYGVTVLMTHHLVKLQQKGKGGAQEPTRDSIRGSGALTRNVDTVFGLIHQGGDSPRELRVWKQKDGSKLRVPPLWMVPLETGRLTSSGAQETSCVLIPDSGYQDVEPEKAPEKGKEDPSAPNPKAIEQLAAAVDRVVATMTQLGAVEGPGSQGAMAGNEIAQALGLKRTLALAAIKQAGRLGKITNVGSQSAPRWLVATDTEDRASGSGNQLAEEQPNAE